MRNSLCLSKVAPPTTVTVPHAPFTTSISPYDARAHSGGGGGAPLPAPPMWRGAARPASRLHGVALHRRDPQTVHATPQRLLLQ